jgi:hypothetical protein
MRPAIDHEPFNKLLDKLSDVFGKRLTPATRQAYWDVLQHHHLSDIEQRAKHCMANAKYFPKPVELTPVKPDQPIGNAGPSNVERLDACMRAHGNDGVREFFGRRFDAIGPSGKVEAGYGVEVTGCRVTTKDGRVIVYRMAEVVQWENEQQPSRAHAFGDSASELAADRAAY